jgi:hypothetical protein
MSQQLMEVEVNSDLYLVKFLVGEEGTPGAPLLHVAALVDAPTGHISGQAEITQALAPPDDVIRILGLEGRIHSFGLGAPVRGVALTGYYWVPFPPPAVGQMRANFTATLVLEAEGEWKGRGSFTYGGHEVDDVPVTPQD